VTNSRRVRALRRRRTGEAVRSDVAQAMRTPIRAAVDRLSGYSDAVFAVIVTIMVLQLRPPHSASFAALLPLGPTIVTYVLSYVFIAIIWINHHHLTNLIVNPSTRLIWINFVHLFLVSLLPFTTSWIAQTDLARVPTITYAALFVLTDGAYNVFEHSVLKRTDIIDERSRRVARRRSTLALGLFTAAAAAAALEPWIGFSLICVALVLHLKPDIGADTRFRRTKKERADA
jgi:uncharacterized membrane protein